MEKLIYLDTNAFELIAENKSYLIPFKKWIESKNSNVVISSATVSELTRKNNKFNDFNKLINDKEINFFFLGRYSLISGLEKKYYPNSFNLNEISLNEEINFRLKGKPFDFDEIKNNTNFVNALNSQINAAEISFPNIIIKWVFQNYSRDKNYSKTEKQKLKQTILSNVRMRLMNELNLDDVDLNYFKVDRIIIEFLFKKHLIQPIRNLKNSDFVDIQHIAYSPYMDYFLTEKENTNILSQIKNNSSLLQNTTIIDLGKFRKQLCEN